MQKLSFCGENYFMIVNKNKVFVATLFHFASIFANIAYWSRFFPKFFPYIGYCVCQCRKIAFAQTPQWIYTFFLIFPFLFSNCAKIQSFFPVQMFCSMFIVFISFLLISFMVLPIFPAFHPFCKRKNQEKRFFSSSCSYSSSNQKKKNFCSDSEQWAEEKSGGKSIWNCFDVFLVRVCTFAHYIIFGVTRSIFFPGSPLILRNKFFDCNENGEIIFWKYFFFDTRSQPLH